MTRGHVDTGPLGVILPTVIPTLHGSVHNGTEGEGTGAMGAFVLDAADVTSLIPKQEPGLIKKFKGLEVRGA